MENRRQTYRHAFSPQEPLRIEIIREASRAILAGTAVNLSITGMRARLPADAGPFELEQLVTVRLLTFSSTPPIDLNLSTPGRIKYIAEEDDGVHLGILFPLLLNTAATAQRDRALGRFLMEAQRRQRRQPPDEGSE